MTNTNRETAPGKTGEPLPVNFGVFMREIEAKGAEVRPSLTQDGGKEIHPDLRGITFQFFVGAGGVGVNYAGEAPKAPWSAELTGHVFEDFSVAKEWLIRRAAELAGAGSGSSQIQDRRNTTSGQVEGTL